MFMNATRVPSSNPTSNFVNLGGQTSSGSSFALFSPLQCALYERTRGNELT
jgi:hypothetical protein